VDGLRRIGVDDLDHRFDQCTRREILARARLYILRVAREQTFVDRALHVDGQAEPGFAVDQADEPAEPGGILDFVLRLEEDRADDSTLPRELFEQLAVRDRERLAGHVLDVAPAETGGQHRGLADLGDALLVHLEEQQIGNLRDIGLIRNALITQHMREVPDLADEGLRVHRSVNSAARALRLRP
jgi:hypothetical protein